MRNDYNNSMTRHRTAVEIDQGLKTYMARVFFYMALGLGLTGVVAFMASRSDELLAFLFTPPFRWVTMLAPFAMAVFLSARINKLSLSAAQGMFWAYSALMGLSLSFLPTVFQGISIFQMFFATGSVFGAMAVYGYTTKRDLTGFGSFLIMGLVGVIVLSLINLFTRSSGLQFILSIVGLFVFIGLTAYDVQKIRDMYLEEDNMEIAGKKAVIGALNLYLDFINIFIRLLYLFGDRR